MHSETELSAHAKNQGYSHHVPTTTPQGQIGITLSYRHLQWAPL